VLTASLTQVVNSYALKRCIIRCHVVEDFWSYRAVFGPNTLFCNWNFRTPAWVNNVIGLHESCLGQLPWDRFTGRVPFTEGFLSSGYQLGFSALLISLEFFPHTCNKSSKVVNNVLVGLCFGNYYRASTWRHSLDWVLSALRLLAIEKQSNGALSVVSMLGFMC
jgi:hypothetical protein